MAKPRLVLIGAVQATAALLEALVKAGGDIRAVLTLSPGAGQARHADYVDLSGIAAAHGIPCHAIGDLADAKDLLRGIAPDVLCVFGWSRLVPPDVIACARLGGIGFHPAPLPVGRGRHPLIWTILLGLEESAACFFRLGTGADDGDILARRNFRVAPDDTAGSLMAKVLAAGCAAVPELLKHLETRGVAGTPQDRAAAVAWRKREAADGRIDFRMTCAMIDRLVRALAPPYPGADAVHVRAGTGKIWRVEPRERPAAARFVEPGRVIGDDVGGPLVACGDGAVVLREHSFAGPLRSDTWFL